ncbi:efflux RND transporter periplasmic adaptor subunit [Nonomuraea fuscirosea]|uniref:efflux RND transporter periplasmic adaptor subunit n=1 Tax=Nonomuraea fuscirosea TaxID=1291556 RepID=UPI0033C1FF86
MRRTFALGGLALAVLVAGSGLALALRDDTPPAVRVRLAAAQRGQVTAAVSAAGDTVDGSRRELAFGSSGTLTKVYVKVGAKVKKGQVLARIDGRAAREAYTAAKADLAAAEEARDEAAAAPTTGGGDRTPATCVPTAGPGKNATTPASTGRATPVPTGATPIPTGTTPVPTGATPAPSGGSTTSVPTNGSADRAVNGPADGPVDVTGNGPVDVAAGTARGAGGGYGPEEPYGAKADPGAGPARGRSPHPTLKPTPTPTSDPTEPEPRPTVTVTVTATATETVTATATATVTATVTTRPTGGSSDGGTEHPGSHPSMTAAPSDRPATTTPTGPPAGPPTSAKPSTKKPTATGKPTGGTKPSATGKPTRGGKPSTGSGHPSQDSCGGTGAAGTTKAAGTTGTGDTGTGDTETSTTGTGAAGTGTTGTGSTGTGATYADTTGAEGSAGSQAEGGLSEEQAAVEVERAEAALQQAADAVRATRIVAPAAGTVLSVAGGTGDRAGTGTFISLGDLDELQVQAMVTESDVGRLKLGQKAVVTLATRGDERHEGTVTAIAPTATVDGRLVRYPVTVAFDDPPAGLMLGQTASVTITTDQASDTIYVPAAAVRSRSDGTQVVTVRSGDQDTAKVVRTGVRGDQYVEVVSGLVESDQVVLSDGTSGEFPEGNWPGT